MRLVALWGCRAALSACQRHRHGWSGLAPKNTGCALKETDGECVGAQRGQVCCRITETLERERRRRWRGWDESFCCSVEGLYGGIAPSSCGDEPGATSACSRALHPRNFRIRFELRLKVSLCRARKATAAEATSDEKNKRADDAERAPPHTEGARDDERRVCCKDVCLDLRQRRKTDGKVAR